MDRLTAWADLNAEGLALMLVMTVIGIVLLLGALFVERLVEPRHEREEFRHLTRVDRSRRQRRSEIDDDAYRARISSAADLIVRNGWQGPEGSR